MSDGEEEKYPPELIYASSHLGDEPPEWELAEGQDPEKEAAWLAEVDLDNTQGVPEQ